MKTNCYLRWVADGVEVSGEGLQVSDHFQALLTPPPASHQPVTYWIQHFFIIRNMTVFGTMFRIRNGFGADPGHDLLCYLSADHAKDTPEALLFHSWKLNVLNLFQNLYIFYGTVPLKENELYIWKLIGYKDKYKRSYKKVHHGLYFIATRSKLESEFPMQI